MSYSVVETPYSTGPRGRMQEKQELQYLNDRLAAYVQKVRSLVEQSGQVDSSGLFRTAKVLEDELANLKFLYDKELDNLRQQLEEANRDKNACQIQCSKKTQTVEELQDRLKVGTDQNRKYNDELAILQRRCSGLELELTDAKAATNQPMEQLAQLRRQIELLQRENADIRARFEQEQLARREAEDRADQIAKKLEFNEQVWAQQVQELRDRLEMSSATILSMESRGRGAKDETSIQDLLKQVRDASEAELQKYRIESEDSYNRNLHSMKVQMDNDAKAIERLNSENARYSGEIGELQAKIRNLEGQIQTLEHQKTSLEEIIPKDRARCLEKVATLEKKLRDLQDVLYNKMQETTVLRDSNIPLKAEIEAMKILMEEEEKRLQLPVSQQYTMASSGLAPNPQHHVGNAAYTSNQGYIPQPSLYPSPLMNSARPYYKANSSYPPVTSYSDPVYTSAYMDEDDHAHIDVPTTTTRYTYETTPAVNKLFIQPSPPDSYRPVGPIPQSKSVREETDPEEEAVKTPTGRTSAPVTTGQGRDYFDQMFHDLRRDTLYQNQRSSPVDRPPSSVYHDYTTSTSSAIGDLKIQEVHPEGKYIRLVNDGKKDAEFGGYMLQQNVGGHPVAVYRFPPKTKFPSNATITVWSGSNDPLLHQPPSDFVWKEQHKWGSGPECTTILCKANGQAVSWTTAAHRFAKNPYDEPKSEADPVEEFPVENDNLAEEESLTELDVNMNDPRTEQVYLRRKKQNPPTLVPSKHPHGSSPSQDIHPHTGQPRPFTYGNDNSSKVRQARSQSTRPDPFSGQQYCGASAQRMGSAPLRRYKDKQGPTIRGSGTLANKSMQETSAPPSAFMKPHQRFNTGLDQLQSQHNIDYLPPMPRPPLFSAW